MNITKMVKDRRSVRTYDGRTLDADTKEKLTDFMQDVPNPFGIPVSFRFLDAKEHGLQCPVVVGTDLYVGGKIQALPYFNAAFGYSFEAFVLYAQSLGLGTVWLGGTMNREAYEQAMELAADERMPCATPIGYTAKKMSVRETMMRKTIKADERLPFEALFFAGTFDAPLKKEAAGALALPLEMVRLAPSAANKQPWRAVAAGDTVHFYLKRKKGFGHGGNLDMQMVDMGIALCHFALTAQECAMSLEFMQNDPHIPCGDMEYIASYRIG